MRVEFIKLGMRGNYAWSVGEKGREGREGGGHPDHSW